MIEFALRRIDTGMLLKRISAFFFDDALNNTSHPSLLDVL